MKSITVFCTNCGTRLTHPLLHLDNVSDMNVQFDGYDLVPPGMFVTDHDVERRWGMNETPERGLRNVIREELGLPHMEICEAVRINIRDTLNSEPGGDRNGCCGSAGLGGLNVFCANCRTAFGTEFADCHQTHSIEISLADAVIREESAETPPNLRRRIGEWKRTILRQAPGAKSFGAKAKRW